MVVAGHVAYVTLDGGEIHALDVTDPPRARTLGRVVMPGRRVGDHVVTARNLVLAAGGGSLGIVRVWPDGRPIFFPASYTGSIADRELPEP
jgi:hypothetical protein